MKMLLIMGVMLAATFASPNLLAQGSLTLNAGDSYTFRFNTLEYGFVGGGDLIPNSPAGRVDGYFLPLRPGSSILFEMYEDVTSLTPVASQTLTGVNGFPSPPGPMFWSSGSWQDLEGAVRVSMLSGSTTIVWLSATAIRSENNAMIWYGATLYPVPEPRTASIITLMIILSVLVSRICRRVAYRP